MVSGASGRGRTGTTVRSRDFKSVQNKFLQHPATKERSNGAGSSGFDGWELLPEIAKILQSVSHQCPTGQRLSPVVPNR